ncbi:MAG TPA: SDR family NAD(P)-dependent oxidoreductase [Candidatus Limnocylindrales bacterium]|nr:SDR family NAD(P)-dependent oxidoreductase [Candidatus Limnocylindrales bacterium]
MRKRILVTGGAGFIGSHLCNELLEQGYRVRVLDNLSEQVHGPGRKRPRYLDPQVELQVGDIRDADELRKALAGVDAVYHMVAAVGVGQSMYQIREYTSINNMGTAVLLEALIEKKVQRLIVASSMSIYGEGLYKAADGTTRVAQERSIQQLKAGDWQVRDERGEDLTPIPTPETKPPNLASIYALNKYDQERMCLMIGRAYGIPAVAMRFFNVYGPNQALSNPYTGVLAIFASSILNGKAPMIFEDGYQQRDFVSVYDVARALRLALETPEAAGKAFNVGSGKRYSIRTVAQRMATVLGHEKLRPEITGKYRVGDIRHCFADISLAREVLGYQPQVTLEEGLTNLAGWLEKQTVQSRVADACNELAMRGLMVG